MQYSREQRERETQSISPFSKNATMYSRIKENVIAQYDVDASRVSINHIKVKSYIELLLLKLYYSLAI